jgi:hypothetical protein
MDGDSSLLHRPATMSMFVYMFGSTLTTIEADVSWESADWEVA